MALLFDATILSPYATSIVGLDYYTNFITRYGGRYPFSISLNINGDYVTSIIGYERLVASSRNAIHGATEGEWYYQDYLENIWTQASIDNAETAISEGRNVIIGLLLNKSSILINNITEICGTLVSSRIKTGSDTLTFTATNTITTDNLFNFITDDAIEITISGMIETANNGTFQIVSFDLDTTPQEIVVDAILVDEVGIGNISYEYEQALSFPRDGLKRNNRVYANTVIPSQIKDATCLLANQFAVGDFFESSQSKEGLRKISIGKGQVSAEFTYESDYLLFKDYKKYLNNEVLQMLEPFLCEPIREFGKKKPIYTICTKNQNVRYF